MRTTSCFLILKNVLFDPHACLWIVGTVSHVLIRAYVAQEKETCALVLVGCFWLFNLENRLSAVSSFCSLAPLGCASPSGFRIFSRDNAMANLGQDAANVPLPVVISTPTNSPRSRSGHSSHNQFQIETRTDASQDGNSTVMYAEDAPREGVPNTVAVNMMNQFNQSNLYQQIQHNEYAFSPTLQTLNVVTHDPAITSFVEETAERRHREVLGSTELEAKRLQDALLLQERQEIARTRLAVGQEAAEYMQKCNQEAEIEITRRQASAQNTVEEYING